MNSSPYLVVRRPPKHSLDWFYQCLMVTPNQPNSDWGSTMPPTLAVHGGNNPTGYQLRFFRVHWRSDTPFRAWFGEHFFYCSVFLLKLLVSIWQRVAHFLSLLDYGVSSCLILPHGLEFSCKGNEKQKFWFLVWGGSRWCFRLVGLVLMLAGLLLAYGVRRDPTLTILTAAAPGRGASLIMLIILKSQSPWASSLA